MEKPFKPTNANQMEFRRVLMRANPQQKQMMMFLEFQKFLLEYWMRVAPRN